MMADSDIKEEYIKEELVDQTSDIKHEINHPNASENQSDRNMVCETTANKKMSLCLTSSNQLNSVPEISDKPFSCTECEFRCNKKKNLSSHMKQVHSDERPFSCLKCQYSYKSKSTLTRHMKHVHCDEKPFSCTQCQYSCKTKSSLTQHMKQVHSDERPFSCPECQFSCKTKSSLTRHMKRFHSDLNVIEQ